MPLVDYPDSEGSEAEQSMPAALPKPVAKAPATSNSNSNFSIDRANPQKIRVKLDDASEKPATHDREPPAKRPRIGGGGGFGGFNSLLPPPKRDADAKPTSTAKGSARKVFSLKTGAEPGFSRESDAELRNFFAEQDAEKGPANQDKSDIGIPEVTRKAPIISTAPTMGNAFMFKPLSVARTTNKKKKPVDGVAKPPSLTQASAIPTTSNAESVPAAQQPKKISLFSMAPGPDSEAILIDSTADQDEDPIPAAEDEDYSAFEPPIQPASHAPGPQDLNAIASDLKLSAAERRQLFGRNPKSNGSAVNISNFNMDAEYLANEEIRASGEQVQHNPLRAITSGKHSLKQLVSQAQGQKDALEESFAQGRRNKKEAGGKYGW